MTVHRRKLPWLFGILLLALGIAFTGCTPAQDPWKAARADQKRVLVTFPPLYCLTQTIAGDDAFVLCFLTTTGPHEYSFNQEDALKANGAKLIIQNGLGLDDAFVDRLNSRAKVPLLNVGESLPKDMLRDMADDDDDDKDEKDAKHDGTKPKGGHHHHGVHDPHIWLGPPQAIAMVDIIEKELAKLDPPHAAGYQKRAAELKEELNKLLADGIERFKKHKSRKFVTMHDSMGYFASAFGLEVIDTIQVQPNQVPEASRLAKLQAKCKERGVDAITYEPQYTRAQPEMLQRQLKNLSHAVTLAQFDPLETADIAAGAVNPEPGYYLMKMRENIDNLAKALP